MLKGFENQEAGASAVDTHQRTWSFHDSNNMRSPVAGMGAEYFQNFVKSFREIASKVAPSLEVGLVPMPRESFSGLHYSCLVVVVREPEINAKNFVYHGLIIGKSNRLPQAAEFPSHSGPVFLNRIVADAYDAVLPGMISSEVLKYINDKTSQVYTSHTTALTDDIDIEREGMMERIVTNSLLACCMMLEAVNKKTTYDLSTMAKNVRMIYDISSGQHTITDALGYPVRASLLIEQTSSIPDNTRTADKSLVNTVDTQVPVLEVAGFVNALYADTSAPVNMFNQVVQIDPNQKPYVPEIVLTKIDFKGGATTMSSVLMALTAVQSAVQSGNFKQALIPRGLGADLDLSDIGYLNITARRNAGPTEIYGQPIDSKGAIGNNVMAFSLVNMLFSDNPVISIDCGMCSADSWMTNLLLMAADDKGLEYRSLIVQAADELTGGVFSTLFTDQMPIFSNLVTISNGYYPANNGQLRDIRDIDTTAIHVLLANQPDLIRDYLNTFSDNNVESLARRESIIRLATSEKAVINGRSYRMTFSKEFIGALFRASAKVSPAVEIRTPMSRDMVRTGINIPNFLNGSVINDVLGFSGINRNTLNHTYGANNGLFGGR